MKTLFFVLIVLFVAALAGKKRPKKLKPGKPNKPDSGNNGSKKNLPGLCLSIDEVSFLCSGTTVVGIKFNNASQTCSAAHGPRILPRIIGQPMRPIWKGNGKGKGKGSRPKPIKPSKSCPNAEDMLQMFSEKYSGEICLMTEMGWMNIEEDMISLDNDTVMTDISSLPTMVADSLTGRDFEMCVAKIGKNMMNYVDTCLDDYTDAEKDQLLSLLNAAANFQCIQHSMAKSCNVFVSNNIRTMLGLPSGRGYGYGHAYGHVYGGYGHHGYGYGK